MYAILSSPLKYMSISIYLAIPILKSHLEFIIERYALYASGEQHKPSELGETFSTEWTRSAIAEIVERGAGHLTQVCLMGSETTETS